MIAGYDYDLQALNGHSGFFKHFIEELLCRSRGVRIVKDVARDNHHVGLTLFKLRNEPFEEMAVFSQAVVAVKDISEVPIGGVKYEHKWNGITINDER